MTETFCQNALTGLPDLVRLLSAAEGFSALVGSLGTGHAGAVDGAWGSSAALTVAALAEHARPLLVVLAHPGDLDTWAEDLAGFTETRPRIFPAWEGNRDELTGEVQGQRLRILKLLCGGHGDSPPILLTTIQALMQPVPAKEELARHLRRLRPGDEVDLEELVAWFVERGLTRREIVELPGEFSRRGGILDVFPPDAETPCRLEFFGDQLESIRGFAPDSQRSLTETSELELTLLPPAGTSRPHLPSPDRSGGHGGRGYGDGRPAVHLGDALGVHLVEHLPDPAWVVLVEPEDLREQAKHYLERTPDPRGLFSFEATLRGLTQVPSVAVSAMPISSMETTCHLRVESVERFSGDVKRVREELDSVAVNDRVLVACHNEAEQKRLGEVLSESRLVQTGRLRLVLGQVRAGFRLVEAGVVVLSDHELFRRDPRSWSGRVAQVAQVAQVGRARGARRLEARAIDSFLDLAENDLVVHVSHGISRFRGMQVLEDKGQAEEHLVLEFAGGTKLYVPSSKIDLVQKYVGGSQAAPELSKLGGTSWAHRKERVQAAVLDLAGDMIELQAVREAQPGIVYPPDTEWQAEFEAAFPYEETPDQLVTMDEIRADMQRSRPMDRLVCGDVGYGKTELAIRAAFKTMDYGKQVAVLVPTTVLAEQHSRTFGGRLAEYPFVVECLSRFRTGAEQKAILERLGKGGVDLVIGTHRLLSADVRFKDLGLVIIDEEQRFGVEHKERLKKLRHTVDVLTLTATPIPRTLHLSLLGVRDISNLETPPRDRLAIETRVVRFDPTLIRHAILRELNRDGQVYFVHNRVYDIHEVAGKLAGIVPEARLAIVHGQMPEHELEEAMLGFVERKSDILVATTIIESGLDIPNVNTIFIDQADQYGLADLHQLRGRVGRYKHRAYCYLLLDNQRTISPTAFRRLKAIEEYTELGAGFKIAMRDLEIRGAGNILGTQQSGHIAAVGYELYCQLLDNAVRALKNEPAKTSVDVAIDLPWRAYLPRDYVPGQRLKIEVYRRLARIRKQDRLEDFRRELQDRFGPIPEPADWLLRLQELRVLAARWQVATIHLENQDLVLGYRNGKRIERLALKSGKPLRIVDAQSAYLRLKGREKEPQQMYGLLKALLQTTP